MIPEFLYLQLHTKKVVNPFPSWADPEGGGTGGPDPPENHQNMGVFNNVCPDLLNNYKDTKPAFNVGTSSAHQRNAISMADHRRAHL